MTDDRPAPDYLLLHIYTCRICGQMFKGWSDHRAMERYDEHECGQLIYPLPPTPISAIVWHGEPWADTT